MDALGNPVRLLPTAGQVPEHARAQALTEGFKAGYVLADKGYDLDALVGAIKSQRAIPVKSNRKVARGYDKAIYKGRTRWNGCSKR